MKNILCLLLLLPIGIFAQTTKSIEPRKENYITTDVFSTFFIHYHGSYFTPRYRLGYIKNMAESTKIGIDIGYGNANSSLLKTGDAYALWEIRPEYYHIINPNRKTLQYFSLELFYIHQKEVFTTQSFFSDENEYLTFDKANYKRHKMGMIAKYGMFVNISNRIGLNWYTGIGLNYRINNYNNFENLRPKIYEEEHFTPYYRKEGTKLGAEFTIGMKLYYRIKS